VSALLGAIMGQSTLDSSAASLFSRSGTTVPDAQKSRVNTAIKALKAAGVWSKLDAFIISAKWQDEQAGLLDWIRPVSLVKNGAASWSATYGLQGAISAGAYFGSAFTPTTDATNYTANSAGIGCYISALPSTDGTYLFGGYGTQAGAHKRTGLAFYKSPNNNSFSNSVMNGADGVSADRIDNTAANSATTGLVQFNRTTSAISTIYMNSTSIGATNNAYAGRLIQDVSLHILANNTNGSTVGVCDGKLAAWWAGAPLDTTEQTALKSIIDTYLS